MKHHAVNVSQDGLGQVLIMPYYTTQADNETLISITNATDQVKAVKVRFREAQNSAEVLDFNLYLSPYDVWTGKVMDAEDGVGAALITRDTSCTVPKIPDDGVAFRNYVYAGAGNFTGDAGDQGMGRTSEGYVEVIEMGVVREDTNPANWATHDQTTGVPANCSGLVGYWSKDDKGQEGVWLVDSSTYMDPPTGSLFGEANIINVKNGVEASEPVTVLDNFYVFPGDLHAEPGSGAPTLEQANPKVSDIFISGDVAVQRDIWNEGMDAVSASLMASSILNGYSVNPAVQSETNWVVTFPTKWWYSRQALPEDREPFTNQFAGVLDTDTPPGPGAALEPVTMSYWDREERVPGTVDIPIDPEGPDFSPTLPPPEECEPGVDPECTPTWVLPYEVNVVGFNVVERDGDTGESTVISESDVLGSQWAKVSFGLVNLKGNRNFRTGWAKMNFGPVYSAGQQVSSDRVLVSKPDGDGNTTVYTGLPVIGFMATVLQNEHVGEGAAYASTAEHRYMRSMMSGNK